MIMARYIDAVAFEKWANENMIQINKDTLRLAPTADVIPIKWIEEYRKGLPEDEIGWQFDYMLEDWRKENESNINS